VCEVVWDMGLGRRFGAVEDAKADALAAAASRKKKLKKGMVGELQADGEEATGGGFLSQVMKQQELYKPAKAKASGLVAVHEKKASAASVKLKGSAALKAVLQGQVDTVRCVCAQRLMECVASFVKCSKRPGGFALVFCAFCWACVDRVTLPSAAWA